MLELPNITERYADRTMIVDMMSSFGAVDIDVPGLDLDVVVSSANKCIQGVPGFSFVIVKRTVLEASKGNARTLSLDLYDQWATLEKDGGKWRGSLGGIPRTCRRKRYGRRRWRPCPRT